MSDLPVPPVSDEVDLRDFPYTPMFRSRLFGSAFHARVSDSGWRAGVTLWLKSWDQTPAGSLPDDDIDLCRLAELGRDLKSWAKVKKEGLWGWFKCSDGRLYHRTVAEGINEAWVNKLKYRWRGDCAKMKKAAQRSGQKLTVPSFEEWVSLGQTRSVPRDKPDLSLGTTPKCPDVVPRENGSKERKGIDSEAKASGEVAELPLGLKPLEPAEPLKARIFGECLVWLSEASGKPKDKLRSHVGRLCQEYGDGQVLDVMIKAQRESPVDPEPWIVGTLQAGRIRSDRAVTKIETIRRTAGAPL